MSSDNPTSQAGASGESVGGAGTSGSEKTWTVLELLTWTTDYFKRNGIETARLDAEVLLAHALEIQRLRLYIDYEKPVLPDERDKYRAMVQSRARDRVPVSQLLGEREFWSLPFKVTSDVLTPRPETETLVEWALSKVKVQKATVAVDEAGEVYAARSAAPSGDEDGSKSDGQVSDSEENLRILDIGTGSGAIALSLASELPHADVTASDLSPAALQIAAENADELRIGERIRFVEGDLFEPIAKTTEERFDVIVSNPPYVARADEASLPPELSHEPEMALFAGTDGLDVIRRLVNEAGNHLKAGGWLGIELSPEQADEVEGLLRTAGFEDVERRFDLASRARVVAGRKTKDD